jgi:hypothetical protein
MDRICQSKGSWQAEPLNPEPLNGFKPVIIMLASRMCVHLLPSASDSILARVAHRARITADREAILKRKRQNLIRFCRFKFQVVGPALMMPAAARFISTGA